MSVPSSNDAWKRMCPKIRRDIEWASREIRGNSRWIARDPLNLRFYYFSSKERDFLSNLDGTRTISEIAEQASAEGLENQWVSRLLSRAVEHQLLLVGAPGRARSLNQKRDSKKASDRRLGLLRLFAIRIPLLDPNRILVKLRPLSEVVFSRFSLVSFSLLLVASSALLVGRWDEVASQIPGSQTMFTGEGVLWLIVCLLFMKLIHEISHALACTRFGGECHEIGFYFLVFTPCLYCDVTDAWKLKSKFSRVMISAAGILAEILIASIACLLWMASYEGLFHSICFNLMVLGTLSTLLINGNPLLRYDGYYILADLVDVPNLREQSTEALWAPVKHWLTNGRSESVPRDAPWIGLVAFGLLAFVYRVFVIGLILWGTYQVFQKLHLEIAWVPLATLFVGGIIFSIAMRLSREGLRVMRLGFLPRLKLVALLLLVVCLISYGLTLPLPDSVGCFGLARPEQMEPVFVQRRGVLLSSMRRGEALKRGDVVARFDSFEDRLREQQISSEVDSISVELNGLRARVNDEPELASKIVESEARLGEKRRQRSSIQGEVDRLIVRAGISGVFYEPEWPNRRSEEHSDAINSFENPLSIRNRGGVLDQGELIGWIIPEARWRVEAFVAESAVARISENKSAQIQLSRYPFRSFSGLISRIDPQPVERLPTTLASKEETLKNEPRSDSSEKSYRVVIESADLPTGLSLGAHATVKIDSRPRSLIQRLKTFLQRNLKI